jgi:UDP-N-acetyl-D-mannosaminuronic acid transferase (WecB/TagA/CpsF family)
MRRARIEWVYRLVNEPWRLASRYVVGNPMYVLRVVSTRFRLGRISGSTAA